MLDDSLSRAFIVCYGVLKFRHLTLNTLQQRLAARGDGKSNLLLLKIVLFCRDISDNGPQVARDVAGFARQVRRGEPDKSCVAAGVLSPRMAAHLAIPQAQADALVSVAVNDTRRLLRDFIRDRSATIPVRWLARLGILQFRHSLLCELENYLCRIPPRKAA